MLLIPDRTQSLGSGKYLKKIMSNFSELTTVWNKHISRALYLFNTLGTSKPVWRFRGTGYITCKTRDQGQWERSRMSSKPVWRFRGTGHIMRIGMKKEFLVLWLVSSVTRLTWNTYKYMFFVFTVLKFQLPYNDASSTLNWCLPSQR